MNHFLQDVLTGLRSSPKHLQSKYFYDKAGDELFQKIMASDEYYLTDCEMEIFSEQTHQIADCILRDSNQLSVIEFGPGDATKSTHLLKELLNRSAIATYFPIDISKNIIRLLNARLPESYPDLRIHGLRGEYLDMLSEVNKISTGKKLILFLGANIGNFKFNEMPKFCQKLRQQLSLNDLVFIGFDLKKNPKKILAAYDDASGFTRQFNLNLLTRINNELGGNFDLNNFEHYAMYDPDNGACKSYLVSLKDQTAMIEEEKICFEEGETIFMEISQKYTVKEIDEIAVQQGFTPVAHFFDSNHYFADVVWRCS